MQGSDGTKMGWDIMLELVKHMDPVDRSAWRLVDKAACAAVYEQTTALSPRSTAGYEYRGAYTYISDLPLPLLAKCSGLKQLSCNGLQYLDTIHGLPAGLEVLDIRGTRVSDPSPLEHCTALRQLSVSGTDAITPQLLSVVRQLTGLQQLSLRRTKSLGFSSMRTLVVKSMATAILQLTGLIHLDLRSNYFGVEGARTLAPALQQLTGLRQLQLGLNGLGHRGVQALAPALLQLTGLQLLHLSHNQLHAEGAQALVLALQHLTGLQRLNLSHNDLGAQGALALAPALQQLTGLHRLDLRGNKMGVAGAQALAPALQSLVGLQQLDVGFNAFGTEGARVLAPVITMLPHLNVTMDSEDRSLLELVVSALAANIG